MSFDWQTEEDGDRGQPYQRPREPAPQSCRGRLRTLLFLAVVAAALTVTWRQLNDRVNDATNTVREDVLASHSLARRAAEQQDEELLASIISGSSRQWAEAQNERLGNGLMFEDSLRPFGFLPVARPAVRVEVTLNPRLSEAVVQARRPFAVDTGGGLTATVHLTHTNLYREGSQRWLLSPPDGAFWGAMQTVGGDLLTLVAP